MGKLTKEEFESLLAQAGLKKKDLCDILDVAPGVVSSWTSKGREPPYWVKSWLENYIAAKAAKTDPILAPIGDWYNVYEDMILKGKADDMQILFKRGNDYAIKPDESIRLITWNICALIMKKCAIVKTFFPLSYNVFINNDTKEKLKPAEIDNYLTDEVADMHEDLPLHSDDTPDAK